MTDEEFYELRNTMNEEWKQLIYNGELQNYDISNTGKIRNHTTKVEYKLAKVPGMKNTYEQYGIVLTNGKKVNTGIHRLMAIMFIPIPKKYIKRKIPLSQLVVDHIDNVKYHNVISNLQWLTYKENTQKYYETDFNINNICLTDKLVKKICQDLVNEMTIYEISCKYNVSELVVYNIRFGVTYTDISTKYKFPSQRQMTEEDVIRVCELLAKGMSSPQVSAETGFSVSSITHILIGDSWTQISKNYTFPNSRLTDKEIVKKICEMLQDGKSLKEVANKFNVSKRTVEHIRAGETHTDISKNYNFVYSKFKVADEIIHNICKDLASKQYLRQEIADRNGVSLSFVKDIKARKYRIDISHQYEW